MVAEAHQAGLDPRRLARIEAHLTDHYLAPGKIAGCEVLVARHGHVAYAKRLGLRDRERDAAWTDDTIVRLYSMTKPVVSVALMMLYERGLFALTDPVSRFIPSWAGLRVWVESAGEAMRTEPPRRPPTMRDMLCHTGGLTYGGLLRDIGAAEPEHPVDEVYRALRIRRDRDETLPEFCDKLARAPLRYHPGEHWMYSLSTDVCGHLVELISGRRLDRFLREEILGPLGMNDTGFFVPPESASRFAACYHRDGDRALALQDDPAKSPFLREPAFLSGGGGLVGTMADYARFCEMLRRGGELEGTRIIGPRTLAMMAMNHLPGGRDLSEVMLESFMETAQTGVGFGLGFAMSLGQARTQGPSVGDYYWGGAASTMFLVDPVEDMVVIFLTQFLPSSTFDFRGQLRSIVYGAIVD